MYDRNCFKTGGESFITSTHRRTLAGRGDVDIIFVNQLPFLLFRASSLGVLAAHSARRALWARVGGGGGKNLGDTSGSSLPPAL